MCIEKKKKPMWGLVLSTLSGIHWGLGRHPPKIREDYCCSLWSSNHQTGHQTGHHLKVELNLKLGVKVNLEKTLTACSKFKSG